MTIKKKPSKIVWWKSKERLIHRTDREGIITREGALTTRVLRDEVRQAER